MISNRRLRTNDRGFAENFESEHYKRVDRVCNRASVHYALNSDPADLDFDTPKRDYLGRIQDQRFMIVISSNQMMISKRFYKKIGTL